MPPPQQTAFSHWIRDTASAQRILLTATPEIIQTRPWSTVYRIEMVGSMEQIVAKYG